MMNNGLYSIVMAFLFVELFKMLIYTNSRTCDLKMDTRGCNITKYGISEQILICLQG